MRIFFIFLSLFLLNSSLSGYSKKIVVGSFNSETNAKRLLNKLPSLISDYSELKQLIKKDNAVIQIKEINNYYLVVIEIFLNEDIAEKSLKIIKKRFKYAYINEASSQKHLNKKVNKTEILEDDSWHNALKFVDFTFLIVFIF